MSEQRLREIAERHLKEVEIAKQYTTPESPDYFDWYMHEWDGRDIEFLLANTRNALAYCDRILAHNPNGAELMFLTEVKRILTGESDGRTITEASDAK